jgi:hypothetical protein
LLDYARNCANGHKETTRNYICKEESLYAAMKLTGNKSICLNDINEKLNAAWEDMSFQHKQEYKDACALALAEKSQADGASTTAALS